MAIQVTGLFQNPATGLIYESPKLTLVPHLEYAGVINMDVHIGGNGTVPYSKVDRTTFTYDLTITDPYNQLIDGLETMVIANLQTANPINEQATFEKVMLVEEETEEEEVVVEEETEEEAE
jgi:hypothetical protein